MKKNCFLIHTRYLVNKDCHTPSLCVFAEEIVCVGVLISFCWREVESRDFLVLFQFPGIHESSLHPL